jgi:hypothetical protein
MIEKTDMVKIDTSAYFLAYLYRMCVVQGAYRRYRSPGVVLLNEISNLLLIYWFSAVVLSYFRRH